MVVRTKESTRRSGGREGSRQETFLERDRQPEMDSVVEDSYVTDATVLDIVTGDVSAAADDDLEGIIFQTSAVVPPYQRK